MRKRRKHDGKTQKFRKEYTSWLDMIRRCHDESDSGWPTYGAVGIKVCLSWRNSFDIFLEDMGPKPTPKHTIDRINNSKGYFPKNCRWVTSKEQARNRKTNVILTFQGESLCVAEWSERTKLSKVVIAYRIKKGWSIEAALTTPLIPKCEISHRNTAKKHTHNGITKTIAKWAKEIGISYHTVWRRIRHYGYSVEDALFLPLKNKGT